MQMNWQSQRQPPCGRIDPCGHADVVAAEDSHSALNTVPFRCPEFLEAQQTEPAGDFQEQLTQHGQDHAPAVGREFGRAGACAVALALELPDPTFHVRSGTVRLLAELVVGDRRKLAAKAFVIAVRGVDNVGLNQAKIGLVSALVILFASDNATLAAPVFALIIDAANYATCLACGGVAGHHFLGGILDATFFCLGVGRQSGDVFDATLVTGVDQNLGVEPCISSQDDHVVREIALDALDKTLELRLKDFAGILGAAGTEHSNGIPVQIAQDRGQTVSLIVSVVRLFFLIAIQVNIGRVDIQEEASIVLSTIARQHLQFLGCQVESFKKGCVEFVDVVSIELILKATQARSSGNAVLTNCREKARVIVQRLMVIKVLVTGSQCEQALFEHRLSADERVVSGRKALFEKPKDGLKKPRLIGNVGQRQKAGKGGGAKTLFGKSNRAPKRVGNCGILHAKGPGRFLISPSKFYL